MDIRIVFTPPPIREKLPVGFSLQLGYNYVCSEKFFSRFDCRKIILKDGKFKCHKNVDYIERQKEYFRILVGNNYSVSDMKRFTIRKTNGSGSINFRSEEDMMSYINKITAGIKLMVENLKENV